MVGEVSLFRDSEAACICNRFMTALGGSSNVPQAEAHN